MYFSFETTCYFDSCLVTLYFTEPLEFIYLITLQNERVKKKVISRIVLISQNSDRGPKIWDEVKGPERSKSSLDIEPHLAAYKSSYRHQCIFAVVFKFVILIIKARNMDMKVVKIPLTLLNCLIRLLCGIHSARTHPLKNKHGFVQYCNWSTEWCAKASSYLSNQQPARKGDQNCSW